MGKKDMSSPIEGVSSVVEGLKSIYRKKILPLEKMYDFHKFNSQALEEGDFDAKPTVLLLGQYSTGKTTFLSYLLEREFPGIHIGPEPTTDRFLAIMHGSEDRVIPGNALAVQADKPYRGLQKFGSGFLNKFAGSQMDCDLLKNFTFVDTPGVLSGEKQRIGRSYEFTDVVRWFAERADMILLLFDAHKLDISDEFKSAIEGLKGNDEKIRVVLNKADSITSQQLMRVYGAMMWSLGKVISTPEVCRVFIGSFWDKPYVNDTHADLFDLEKQDLFKELMALPKNSAIRKINELVKRARAVRVHALLIGHLKSQMPSMFGKDKKKEELIKGLGAEFKKVQQMYQLPAGDFPDIKKFRENLQVADFTKFSKLDQKLIDAMDKVLANDLPTLMKQFPTESGYQEDKASTTSGRGGWLVSEKQKAKFDEQFHAAGLVDGKLSGQKAKGILVESGLNVETLGKIWELADLDKDGNLDDEEFAICMFLIEDAKMGKTVPDSLPDGLIPPSMREESTNPFA